jgi:hypothetical protein
MPGTMINDMDDFAVAACCGYLPDSTASVLMNPFHNGINPLQDHVGREQKERLPEDLKGAMNELLNALHQIPDETAYVDIGGKDTRPSDLTTHFNPGMDQDINLYTGGGDDMVIIV